MQFRAAAANLLWAGGSLPAWRRHRAALRDPLRSQTHRLVRYLQENCRTAFGQSNDFAGILARAARQRHSSEYARALVSEYQARVPLATYEDFEPFIERVLAGESRVLTASAVRRLLPSSGSTSAVKLLPGTMDAQRELTRAVDVWVADLFLHHPALLGGQAYWSISPAMPVDRTAAVPIGFADDSEYLAGSRGILARAVVAVPEAVSRVYDAEAFRYVTLLFLARAQGLRLVSVWHPTFFLRLLDGLPEWMDRLARDISEGTLTPPGVLDPAVRTKLESPLAADPRRGRDLARLKTLNPLTIWPRLAAISCWADGPARLYADDLVNRMPGVRLQPKGLVATEGIVTIPFAGRHPIAVRSHFFEFLDRREHPRLAHELEEGAEYTVVLTTGAGLYRYRLGDRVKVDGWVDRTPSLRFVGRDDRVSDRFGEKLSDGFVAGVIDAVFERHRPRFAMLAPEDTAGGTAYTLFVESERPLPPALHARLERELRRNPHYAWCVDIGQLRPARALPVGPNADRAYVAACVAKGQKLGDVKPVFLHRESGWESVLPVVRSG